MTKPERSNTNIKEVDLAQDKMGDNDLQANDQRNVRNQREAVPDVKKEADGVVESFEKMDKDVRAKRDLHKKE
ncbi:hypothetical protein [Ahrensia sp. 13_GOM-1096m]|uniref:hypothetical protein n=1 Tax=Ahrensia sp. 13_GOM-1096m TaxID=1380380 RepID=UPI00047AA54F|nr:hypothetical protein [Ahrensia sp. 13_GOM-1096m]